MAQTAETLLAENAALVSRISQLKFKLGIAQVQDDNEKKRIKSIFASFDRDNNGFIDRDEFEVLAYECGGDLNSLTDENIDAQFKVMNPSGDGKITYEAFYKWLTTEKSQNEQKQSDDSDLYFLKMRLLSRSWFRQFNVIKDELVKNDGNKQPQQPQQVNKANERTMTKIHAGIGHFQEAKSSITISAFGDAQEAESVRQQVECPNDVTAFVHIDFELKADADDLQIGELCGMLEVVLDTIPFDQLPVKVHHSHKVDVHENEQGQKFLRVVLFSNVNAPHYMELIGLRVDDHELFASKAKISLELLPSLTEFLNEPEKCLTLDMMKARFVAQVDLDATFEDKLNGLIDRLPEGMQDKLRLNLAMMEFLRKLDVGVQFTDLKDFVEHLPDAIPECKSAKAKVEAITNIPIGKTLKQLAEGVRETPIHSQKELYNNVLQTALGLSRIHFQFSTLIVRVDLKGLNFVPFLPQL